jgi:hypothetical protein
MEIQLTDIPSIPGGDMQETDLVLTPLSKLRVYVALHEKRVRRADYSRTFLALTLSDGTVLQLHDEAEVIIALRCLTSGAHAGMTPIEARAAERAAANSVAVT